MVIHGQNTLQCLVFSVICFVNVIGSVERGSTIFDESINADKTTDQEFGSIDNTSIVNHTSGNINYNGTEIESEIGTRSLYNFVRRRSGRRRKKPQKPRHSFFNLRVNKPKKSNYVQPKFWFENHFEPTSVVRQPVSNRGINFRDVVKNKLSKYSKPSANLERTLQDIMFNPPTKTNIVTPSRKQNDRKSLLNTNSRKQFNKPPPGSTDIDPSKLLSKEFVDRFMKRLFESGKTAEKNPSPMVPNRIPFNEETFNSAPQGYISNSIRPSYSAKYPVLDNMPNYHIGDHNDYEKLNNMGKRNRIDFNPISRDPSYTFPYSQHETSSPFHSTSVLLTNILNGLLPPPQQKYIGEIYPLENNVDYRKEFLKHSRNTETDSPFRKRRFRFPHIPDENIRLFGHGDPLTIRQPTRRRYPAEDNEKGYDRFYFGDNAEINASPNKPSSDSKHSTQYENWNIREESPNFSYSQDSRRQKAREEPPINKFVDETTQINDDEPKIMKIKETPTPAEDERRNYRQPQNVKEHRQSDDDFDNVTKKPKHNKKNNSLINKDKLSSSQNSANEKASSLKSDSNRNNGFPPTSGQQNLTQHSFGNASEDFYLEYLSSSLMKPKRKKTINKYQNIKANYSTSQTKSNDAKKGSKDDGDSKKLSSNKGNKIIKESDKKNNGEDEDEGEEVESYDDVNGDENDVTDDEEEEAKYDDTSNDSV